MAQRACWCMTVKLREREGKEMHDSENEGKKMHGKRNRGQGNQRQGGGYHHHHHQGAKRRAKGLCAGGQGVVVESVWAASK